eukprot:TRINITY_DN21136_c0_g1_i1.p1 TRINITY_DN21136_c0_g1~~TRINITY_DN21136_c0_g1_i1.p1  ORF type:complete len:481 (-),score=190.52 TRINITY_DN21136_c0_g1_i1:286-1560(-)
MPQTAEQVLARGDADMVSMARPLLADPYWVRKAAEGREDEINTCIACNQACLDHSFVGKLASCLVNPRAGHETELRLLPVAATKRRRVAVVGAGPAGLACATSAAQRGHKVTLFESASDIGGQFNMAKAVPGKEEFHETIRYFKRQLELTGVEVVLNKRVSADDLISGGYEQVVLATGVVPRQVDFPGSRDHRSVLSYVDVLRHKAHVGKRVAIIGAGGIGFDVAEYLLQEKKVQGMTVEQRLGDIPGFLREWGIDPNMSSRGGLAPALSEPAEREIYLCQRKPGALGKGLGKTTGWIHRASLKKHGVHMISGVKYRRVDDEGLHVTFESGEERVLAVDNVIICAGQEPLRDLQEPLGAAGIPVFRIGGSELAAELDAKRAIDQGTRLAAVIEDAQAGQVFNAPLGFKAQAMDTLKAFTGGAKK